MTLLMRDQDNLEKGREEGLKLGREQGLEEGLELGREQGLEQGREQGREEGVELGREQGIKMMIATLSDFHISQDQIRESLQKRYGLTAEEVARYLE